MSKITYEFADGSSMTGTSDQILTYAKTMGLPIDTKKLGIATPRGFYASRSKGLIKISEMDNNHIINCLNKLTIEYYTDLKGRFKEMSIDSYLKLFVGFAENSEIEDLFLELQKRSPMQTLVNRF
jgi:hypothetical protein